MAPPALSDLIFPEQANHNFSRILGDLKRANLSVTNRLHSIRQDASFVDRVSSALGRPLVSNERCGSWYVDPGRKAASAYFKSTDGHTGQWKFSTRRLNLHLLRLIGQHDGCIIVDSTRRGKSMPDALSKTVPVWCCVLNRTLFPEDPASHELHVPPDVVSPSEHSQMVVRIPDFVESFAQLGLDLEPLKAALSKPLRPCWVTQETPLDPAKHILKSLHPVICCTSSRRVLGTEMSEAGYIQGAGDDTENWAHGLTPPVFWAHTDELLATPESGLSDLIATLLAVDGPDGPRHGEVTRLAPQLLVGRTPLGPEFVDPSVCRIILLTEPTEPETWTKSTTCMEVGLGKHKLANRNLRHVLGPICAFAQKFLEDSRSDDSGQFRDRVLVACKTGKDLAVGVSLALLCWCFDDEGKFVPPREPTSFTKSAIRMRLGRIMTLMPDANPSRATLQSVNSFLMDWRK